MLSTRIEQAFDATKDGRKQIRTSLAIAEALRQNYTYFQWLFFFWGLLGMVDRGADLSRLSQYFDSYMCVGRRE